MEPRGENAILGSRRADIRFAMRLPVARAPSKENHPMNARPVVLSLLAAPICAAVGGALLAGPTSGLFATLIPKPGAVFEADAAPIAARAALPAERVSR